MQQNTLKSIAFYLMHQFWQVYAYRHVKFYLEKFSFSFHLFMILFIKGYKLCISFFHFFISFSFRTDIIFSHNHRHIQIYPSCTRYFLWYKFFITNVKKCQQFFSSEEDIFIIISLIIALLKSFLFKKKIFASLLSLTLHPLFLRSRKEITLSKRVIDCRPIGAQFKSSNDSLSLFLSFSLRTKRKFDNINRDCLDTVPPQ